MLEVLINFTKEFKIFITNILNIKSSQNVENVIILSQNIKLLLTFVYYFLISLVRFGKNLLTFLLFNLSHCLVLNLFLRKIVFFSGQFVWNVIFYSHFEGFKLFHNFLMVASALIWGF